MKAHPHRRLTFHQIVIVREAAVRAQQQQQQPQQEKEGSAGGEEAAAEEGEGEGGGKEGEEDPRSSGPTVAQITGDGDADAAGTPDCCYASVSISHDGDYATAVCLGLAPSS